MFAFYLYMLNFLDLIVGHFDIFSNFAPRIELIGMPSSLQSWTLMVPRGSIFVYHISIRAPTRGATIYDCSTFIDSQAISFQTWY